MVEYRHRCRLALCMVAKWNEFLFGLTRYRAVPKTRFTGFELA